MPAPRGLVSGAAYPLRGSGRYERNLKLDLLAAQSGRGGQGRNLVERTGELFYRFDQRRALKRPLSSLAPQDCGFLDQAGLGAVTRQQFRLGLGDLRELAFKGSAIRACNARRASRSSVP